jgi:hypothetical protein
LGDTPPEKFPLMELSDICEKEMISVSFPEFEHYIIEDENINENEKGIMDKIFNVLDTAYYNGLHLKERAKNELKKSGFIEKIKEKTKNTYENIKTKGIDLYENSKPLINDFKQKTIIGVNSIKEKTKGVNKN